MSRFFCSEVFVFGSLAHRLSKHLVASQYVGNEPWKVGQNHGSSLQGPGPISILSGQYVSLLVVDAGDGGTEVVGAEGLDGHLLDDMLELRGGHLDLVDLAGQHLGVVLVHGGLLDGDVLVHGGVGDHLVGVVDDRVGVHSGDDVVLGLALGLAGHLEAEEVLAAGLLELGLEGLDLDVVGLGHVLDLIGLLHVLGHLLDLGGDVVVDDRGVVGVRHGVGVGERLGVGQHGLDLLDLLDVAHLGRLHLMMVGMGGGERHGEHQLQEGDKPRFTKTF